jgi:hypothetical protein
MHAHCTRREAQTRAATVHGAVDGWREMKANKETRKPRKNKACEQVGHEGHPPKSECTDVGTTQGCYELLDDADRLAVANKTNKTRELMPEDQRLSN